MIGLTWCFALFGIGLPWWFLFPLDWFNLLIFLPGVWFYLVFGFTWSLVLPVDWFMLKLVLSGNWFYRVISFTWRLVLPGDWFLPGRVILTGFTQALLHPQFQIQHFLATNI